MFVEAILRACRKIPKRARTNRFSLVCFIALSSHKFINIFVSAFFRTLPFCWRASFASFFDWVSAGVAPTTHLLYPPERKARFTLPSLSLSGTSFRECPDVRPISSSSSSSCLRLCCTQPHTHSAVVSVEFLLQLFVNSPSGNKNWFSITESRSRQQGVHARSTSAYVAELFCCWEKRNFRHFFHQQESGRASTDVVLGNLTRLFIRGGGAIKEFCSRPKWSR